MNDQHGAICGRPRIYVRNYDNLAGCWRFIAWRVYPVPGITTALLSQLATTGGAASSLFNLLDLLSERHVSRFFDPGDGCVSILYRPDIINC